jgi:outer membrane lipoprotein
VTTNAPPNRHSKGTRRPRTIGIREFVAALSLLLLAGCATLMPHALRSPEPVDITPQAVRAAPERHISTPVRWGGSILAVRNASNGTDIELLARPLDAEGEPRTGAEPQGRIIARAEGFIDPAEYPVDRLLSISGYVEGVETRNVGDYPYRYPVVRVVGRHLWPEPPPVIGAPWGPPGWGWPWGGPWGYGGWYGPYYGPYGPRYW